MIHVNERVLHSIKGVMIMYAIENDRLKLWKFLKKQKTKLWNI